MTLAQKYPQNDAFFNDLADEGRAQLYADTWQKVVADLKEALEPLVDVRIGQDGVERLMKEGWVELLSFERVAPLLEFAAYKIVDENEKAYYEGATFTTLAQTFHQELVPQVTQQKYMQVMAAMQAHSKQQAESVAKAVQNGGRIVGLNGQPINPEA